MTEQKTKAKISRREQRALQRMDAQWRKAEQIHGQKADSILHRAIHFAVRRWLTLHGKTDSSLHIIRDPLTPEEVVALRFARRLTSFQLEQRINRILNDRQSVRVPPTPFEAGPYALNAALAFIHERVYALLSERYRIYRRISHDGQTENLRLEKVRSRDGLRQFGDGRAFRCEMDDPWSEEETRRPSIYGEESTYNRVPTIYTGGFETNRSRH